MSSNLIGVVAVFESRSVAVGDDSVEFFRDPGISQATMKVGPTDCGNREQCAEEERAIVISARVGVLSEGRFARPERERNLRGCGRCRIGERPSDHGVGTALAPLAEIGGSLSSVDVGDTRLAHAVARTRRPDGKSGRICGGRSVSIPTDVTMALNTAFLFGTCDLYCAAGLLTRVGDPGSW
jgi:hypothetical protein